MRTSAWIAIVVLCLPSLSSASPRWTAQEDAREEYGELARTRHREAMEQLKDVLRMHGTTLDPEVRGEALFRLADLQWTESLIQVELAVQDLDERYEAWMELPAAERSAQTEPRLDERAALSWVRRASETWRSLALTQPNHERAPEAEFFRAMCLDRLGKQSTARELREQFVVRWPDHRLAAEALTGIGEYWFWADNPYKAIGAYRRAAETESARSYPLVLFRIAWCLRQMDDLEEAKDAFVAVLREAVDARREERRGAFELEDESRAALAHLYAETGDVEGARDTFCRLDPSGCRLHVAAVGNGLEEMGETDRAIAVWRDLIEEAPWAPDDPSLEARVLLALKRSDRFEEAAASAAAMARRYGQGSRWARANVDNEEVRREATALVEANLRTSATRIHRAALAQRSDPLLELAEQTYATYLDLYPATNDAYELRFWHAEALFGLGRFDHAANEYERVAAADPAGRFLADALAGTIYAIEEHLQELGIDVP